MIRWKGFIAVFVLVGGLFATGYFLITDEWIEEQIELAATDMNKAKVELDGFKFSFTEGLISWNRLQVTDPKQTKKNLIETEKAKFKIEMFSLLSKKVIIENFQLSEFRLNTDRKTDGALPKPRRTSARGSSNAIPEEPSFLQETTANFTESVKSKLNEKVNSLPKMDISSIKSIDTDNIVNSLELTSVKRLDSAKTSIEHQYASLDAQIKEIKLDKDYKEVEQIINSIDLSKLKTLNDYKVAYEKVDRVVKKIEHASRQIKTAHKDLKTGISSIKQSVPNIQKWVSKDYEKATKLAKLPDLNAQNIGQLIFGPKVAEQIGEYLGYVQTARKYAEMLKSDQPKELEPERYKGQTIRFSSKYNRPDLWIKNIQLSGYTNDGARLSGTITDITSSQPFIGKPTIVDLKGKNSIGVELGFKGEFNYLDSVPKEQFDIDYLNIPLKRITLAKSGILPTQLRDGVGKAQATVQFVGSKLNATLDFIGNDIKYAFKKKAKNKTERLVRSVIEKTNTIDFNARISESGFNIKSNLDKLLMKNLRDAINKEVEKAKRQIRQRIDNEVAKYKNKVDKIVKDKEKQLLKEYKKYEDKYKNELKKIDKKKKEIEKDQKKKLKNKLKDLFKF